MLHIITTDNDTSFEDIANYNKHLVEEGEAMTIKSCYGKRVYYKVNVKMQLTLK